MGMERELRFDRLRRLIIGRPLVVTPLLGLFLLFNFGSIQNTPYETGFYLLIALTWCLTFLYLLALPWIKHLLVFTLLQIIIDLCLITLLTGMTGGVESPFSIFYIVTIVSASVFFYQKGGIPAATAALLLLGAVVLVRENPNKEFFYRFLLHAIAFYFVGGVSGRFFNKLHEKDIRLSKLQVLHETIVKNIPSGVVTTDLSGRITSFNTAASQIIGVEISATIETIWWDLFNWEGLKKQYENLIRQETLQRFEGEIEKKDGSHCFLGITISLLRNDQKETIGVIGIFQDLTHLKKLEEEMNQKRWLAVIGEMAAGMAHEIRNPLTALSGSVQLLKSEKTLSADNHRLMEIVLYETERLNKIITQFILYAKPLPPCRKPVSLKELLYDSLELIKNAPEAAKQVIRTVMEVEQGTMLFVDPDQMKQVFWNLSINAFAAMPQGGTLTLRVKMLPKRRAIEISFQDTGSGILRENLPKIFYPFFTTKSSGSGLGLPQVQRIIEQHAGNIEVTSTQQGTVFKIQLPQEGLEQI